MSRPDDTVDIPALGRPFQLGMLYDCRSDSLIPGITLWDLEKLHSAVDIKPQPWTESEVIASDTIEDKANALSVTASLKASFLGGLVEVGGSAKYLNDTKKSKQQARITLKYSATTRFEQLSMNHLGAEHVSYREVFDQGTATHVVTAVLYGAQAFFVFDREVSSSENIQEIEGSLQVSIKKLPLVSIEGEGALKMDDKEKAQAEKFSCKFYGDFALENNPATFQDAIKIYCTLPKLLGDKGEKAVPVKVWLYPLTKLDSKAAKLMREISLTLISDAQTAMEELAELEMRCNDMLKNPVATNFPEIKRKIHQFKDLCKQHRQSFQKQLAGLLPSIRGGGEKEKALVEILLCKNQSPFNTQRLNEFLDTKEREMNYVNSCLIALSNVDVVSSQSELDKIRLNPGLDFVVCFTFTSLHEEEPYLSVLKQWLQTQYMEQCHDDSASARSVSEKPKSKMWFEEKEIFEKARKSAKSLSKFAGVNKSNGKTKFVVASVPDKDNPGTSIYLYEDGELVSTNFEPPSKPLPPQVDGIRHDHVQFKFKPAAYGKSAISGYQVEYRIVERENWTAVNASHEQETFTITGLHPNTEYQFRYAAVSKPGLSKSSDMSGSVKTLSPTSPPGKPEEIRAESSAIALSWQKANVIVEGVTIKEYKVEYKEESEDATQEGKDKWLERRTGKRTESCTIDRLKPQTSYRFRVLTVCVDGAVSDPSEEILISTLKEDPSGSTIDEGLLKPYVKPAIPFTGPIPGGLHDRMMVTFSGTVLNECDRFSINFQCGSRPYPYSDIAFHFEALFEANGCVVCNTLKRQSWGIEKIKKEMPFFKGRPFEIWVLVQQNSFLVAVNGNYFVEYKHRIPISKVDTIGMSGDVQVAIISFQNVPPVPYYTAIPGGLYPSKSLLINGIVPPNSERFNVELVRGRDTAFALSPRFPEDTLVRNSLQQHSWGQEECSLPRGMPLGPGQSFTINILCEAHCFKVTVNGQHQFEYKHQVPDLQQIDWLEIEDDVLLTSVQV